MKNGSIKAGIIATILLLVVALLGAGVLSQRRSGNQAVEIMIPIPEAKKVAQVYVEGAVAKPGLYPLKEGGSVEDVLTAAGDTTANADRSRIKIYVPEVGESSSKPQSQKININTADARLLDSLPGIGPVRARDIIDYRAKNGDFRNTRDITKVKGIGPITYEKLKDLITVAD